MKRPATKPGKGLFGWLGRQVGYVTGAVKTPVAGPPDRVVWSREQTAEQPHPQDPSLTLRRRVVDEVVRSSGVNRYS